MDRRGGCCIAKYDGGGGGGYYNNNNRMSEVDLIMRKYRPIAPKPVAGGSGVSGGFAPDNRDLNVKNGRQKRRYKSNNRRCVNRGSKASPEKSSSGGSSETVVTLPLLSETPESSKIASPRRKAPIWLSFDRKEIVSEGGGVVSLGGGREVKVAEPVRLVGSCVTVECVTDTWMDGNGLGRTDEEKVMNLDVDTCPGFVSDGYNGVKWTNKAYREMVGGEDTMVWLVMKDLVLLPLMCDAFTCRVKVTCRGGAGAGALTLPCDVWRLNNGGFAWRLDLKAALSLGR